ncbi:hypothetical protein IE077_002463 [Cardiosporidium cionae]|uniref:Exportin-T n=1 Tax=Cardiosporidium cionae TaxID=476202 RepID=A0ABQ7JAS2_9APIC|nr:hypothetical protein IE077_002463 [Cardiosporidium cionae]|eukprot:KAF8821102.1 hypothetical protein IE077_002463 [Cardiosporidium cionae]
MDKLEEAVIILFTQDPSVPTIAKQNAHVFCEEVRNSPMGWKLCLDEFLKSRYLEVQFWCLQLVIEKCSCMEISSRQEIIRRLMIYLESSVGMQLSDYAVMTKFCLLYVRLIQLDYPSRWPSAFSALLRIMDKHPSTIRIFIKILLTLDQELVEEFPRTPEERASNMMVKDSMRTNDIESLVQIWFSILQEWERQEYDVITGILQITGKFIAWIDVRLVVNNRFMPILFSLLERNNPYAESAFDCLSAIVYKRMDASSKISLLKEFEILPVMLNSVKEDITNIDYLQKQADALSIIGLQILEVFLSLHEECSALNDLRLRGLLNEKYVCCVVELGRTGESSTKMHYSLLMQRHFCQFQRETKITSTLQTGTINKGGSKPQEYRHDMLIPLERIVETIRTVLGLCLQKVEFPAWFNFDSVEKDGLHANFVDFRKDVTKLYISVFLVSETVSLEWLLGVVTEVYNCAPRLNPTQIEAVLYMFYTAAQQYRDLLKDLKRSDHPFNQCLHKLLSCDTISQSDNTEIRILMLSIFVRYSKFFQLNTSLFLVVLETMLDNRGIFCLNSKVRSQTAMMLLRFVKRTLSSCEMFTDQIISVLPPILILIDEDRLINEKNLMAEVSQCRNPLSFNDQLYLFEAIGWLIGSRNTSIPEINKSNKIYLRRLLTPLSAHFRQISYNSDESVNRVAVSCNLIAKSIQAMASLSKGFLSRGGECNQEWKACLELTCHAMQVYKDAVAVREAALFLCRRMLSVLGTESLPLVCTMLPVLYDTADIPLSELNQLGLFVVHLILTFKDGILIFIESCFFRLFKRHYQCWIGMKEDSPEFAREKGEVQRLLCQICQTVSCNFPAILHQACSCEGDFTENSFDCNSPAESIPSKIPHIIPAFLLNSLASNVSLNSAAFIYSIQTWSNLVKFCFSTSNPDQALALIPVRDIVRTSLLFLLHLDLDDANSIRIIQETSSLFRILVGMDPVIQPSLFPNLLQRLKTAYFDAFVAINLEGGSLDGQMIVQNLLDSTNPQDFYETLRQWISNSQSRRNSSYSNKT